VQEVSDEGEGQQQGGEGGVVAGRDDATAAWITSLVPGSMLDVCNKHGVWFEVCS
jgi:hypothetical protein